MDFCYFIGIDISKDTLDWAVYTQQQGIQLSIQTDNTLKGIQSALAQLKALPDWKSAQAVYFMEHTAPAARRYLQCSFTRSTPRVKMFDLVRVVFADQTGWWDATGQNRQG